MDYIISILPQMWVGTIETLKLFFITIVLSIPLGVLLALARVSSFRSLRSAVGVYVWLLRGTPLMLQLLVVYFGPYYMFGMRVSNSYRLSLVSGWTIFRLLFLLLCSITLLISARSSAPVSRPYPKASTRLPAPWA